MMQMKKVLAKELEAEDDADFIAATEAKVMTASAAQAEDLEYRRDRAMERALQLLPAPAPANDMATEGQDQHDAGVPFHGGKSGELAKPRLSRFCALPIAAIGLRAEIRPVTAAVAKKYAKEMKDGIVFTPALVFEDRDADGNVSWELVEGHHRRAAHLLLGRDQMNCEVRDGSLCDARVAAAGSNTEHGLHRSNEDKWTAVGITIELCPTWSDNRKAKHCGVSPSFVKTVKDEYARVRGLSNDGVEVRVNSKGQPFLHTPRSKLAATAGGDGTLGDELVGAEAASVGAQFPPEPESPRPVEKAVQPDAATGWTFYAIDPGDLAPDGHGDPTGDAVHADSAAAGTGQAPGKAASSRADGVALDRGAGVDHRVAQQPVALPDELQVPFTTADGKPAEFTLNLKDPTLSAPPQEVWALTKLVHLLRDLRAKGVPGSAIAAISQYIWADVAGESVRYY